MCYNVTMSEFEKIITYYQESSDNDLVDTRMKNGNFANWLQENMLKNILLSQKNYYHG